MAIQKIDPKELLSMKNIDEVVNNKNIPASVHIDPTTADAYNSAVESAEHVSEVTSELQKTAENVITEDPATPEVKNDSVYTHKYTLDESINDFDGDYSKLSDISDEDEYLDYDMFDFIYGIVTNSWPNPKNPLNHPIRKFEYTGQDDYINTNSNKGVPQVSTDINGNVVVYADQANAFDDVKAVCKHYKIRCGVVTPKKSKDSKWNFSFTIYVPVTSDGFPVMVEDFFAEQGLTMSDVIEDHKVGGGKLANWGKTYEKNVAKDRKGVADIQNDNDVSMVYDEWTKKAGRSNEPLDKFIKGMFAELDEKGLTYSKNKLKKQFIDYFEDDFED